MNNKELATRLTEYLLTQDPETIALACAHFMIDLHRVRTMSDLPLDEMTCLLFRIDHNSKQLMDFAKNGPNGQFILKRMNSDS